MAIVVRSVGATAAGLLVAFIVVIAVELFSSVVHPLPPDFGNTQEEMCRHVEHYPAWVLAVVVPAWAAVALAGTWTAGRVGNRGSAHFVGMLILAALVLNLSMLPYPLWFKAACLVAIPCGIVAGLYWSGRRVPAALRSTE